jgi:hypothetical protein
VTPNEMANRLVAAGQSLIAVLDAESTALTETRLSRVNELHGPKESAVATYESIVRSLGSDPGVFAGASTTTRQAVIAMKELLDTASSRNINALRAALEMNRRLVQTIANSVSRQRIAASGYTKTGAAYSGASSAPGGGATPMSLNETL